MYNKVLNDQSKPLFTGLMPNNCQCDIHFSVCSRFFVDRASQALFWHSQFFSESELRFSRNYYVIIPFQIEWPDRTSQMSMETVAFAVFFPV